MQNPSNTLLLNLTSGNNFANLPANGGTYSIQTTNHLQKLKSSFPYDCVGANQADNDGNQFAFIAAEHINGFHIPRSCPSNIKFQQYYAICQDWNGRNYLPKVPLYYYTPYYIKYGIAATGEYVRVQNDRLVISSSVSTFNPSTLNKGITPGVNNLDYMFVIVPNGIVTDSFNTSAEAVLILPLSQFEIGTACIKGNRSGGPGQPLLIEKNQVIVPSDDRMDTRRFWIARSNYQRVNAYGVDTYRIFSSPYRYDGKPETTLQMNAWRERNGVVCLEDQARNYPEANFNFIPAGVDINYDGLSGVAEMNTSLKMMDGYPMYYVNNSPEKWNPDGVVQSVQNTLTLTRTNTHQSEWSVSHTISIGLKGSGSATEGKKDVESTTGGGESSFGYTWNRTEKRVDVQSSTNTETTVSTTSVKNNPGSVPAHSVGKLSLYQYSADAANLLQCDFSGTLGATGYFYNRRASNSTGISEWLGSFDLIRSVPSNLVYYVSTLSNAGLTIKPPVSPQGLGDQQTSDGRSVHASGVVFFTVKSGSSLAAGNSVWETNPIPLEERSNYSDGQNVMGSNATEAAAVNSDNAKASGSGISAARMIQSAAMGNF